MSALVARSPLQPLNMSAAQRNKRKTTTRMNIEDDDVLPAKKKSKVDAEVNGANGKPVGGRTRRTRQVYNEEVDGFAFRRKTKKAAESQQSVPVVETVPAVESKSKSKASPSAPAPRRRSARLSADNEPVAVPARKQRKTAARNPAIEQESAKEREEQSPAPADDLQVSKSRSNGTTIALPFADTPVIRRNKEMRAAHGGRNSSQNRRSSTGLRGRRASSLIESGTSNAIPHDDVAIADFYKLIEQGLPEPKRMRHLLIWCGTKALLDKPKGKVDKDGNDNFVIESARQIQEELIKDFSAKNELTDWWSREDNPAPSIPKKPNPRNVRNQEKLKEIEEEIKRLEVEEQSWNQILDTSPQPQHSQQPDLSISSINISLLSESQRTLISSLSLPTTTSSSTTSTTLSSVNARLQSLTTRIEPTIDAFTDGIHKLGIYSSSAASIADRIKGIWAQKLDKRDEEARIQGGSGDLAARDVLRALSGKVNER